MRWWPFLLVLAGLGFAQEEDEPEDEEGCSVIEIGGAEVDGGYDIRVDPFPPPESQTDEPNRPPPIKVGEWQAPELDDAARAELARLLERRQAAPDDAGVRYRLAEFYLEHRWYPHAEAELLRCADLEPESIRPWEALLRVYRAEKVEWEEEDVQVQQGGFVLVQPPRRQSSWLASDEERNARITRAYRELLERRPDDVARRREFLEHLKALHDHPGVTEQARRILAQLPGDADTRYDLSEALRRDPAGVPEAIRLLEENVALAPDHVPSLIRLARHIAVRDGTNADERIGELEKRAFFHLFLKKELADVAYREDILRIARSLAGPGLANRLWDDLMEPASRRERPWWQRDDVAHYTRWIVLRFPHSMPRERLEVIRSLARRTDAGAAAALVSFLWHFEDPELLDVNQLAERQIGEETEAAAIESCGALGAAGYPAAERFLRAARTHAHRRRAIGVMRLHDDPRAVAPLLDALAWDTEEQFSYGVAAALAHLGDARAIDGLVAAALDVRRPADRRREAAEALASFRDARSVEAFNRLLGEPDLVLVASYGLFRLTGDDKAFARLRAALRGGERADDLVRYLSRCEEPRVRDLLLEALVAAADPASRERVVEILRERYWEEARDRVKAIFLEEAASPGVGDLAIRELGRIGGPDAADRLLGLLDSAQGERWTLVARALAETGDPRAVSLFNRLRILEKDAGRRTLAAELHARAAARQAERARARG